MVPNGWEHKAFGEVVKLSKSKYDPKKSTDCFPCIELEHIVQETGQLTGNVPASNLGSTKNKFKAVDVIFGKLRPYLRKFAQPNFDGVCSSEIWVFSPTKKIINPYLFQLVQTNQFISEANKSAGSKMPRADWGVVSEMIFPLPPLPEQRKIAKILSTWDNAISTTERLIDNSKQQKKALMQQLLTGKKRLLDESGKQFQGEWKQVHMEEACFVNPKKSAKPADGLVSFVPMDAVSEDTKLIRHELKRYDEVSKGFTSFENQDCLVAKITPCFENGKGAYVDNLHNGIGFGSTEFHVLRAREGNCTKFIYYISQTREFRVRGEMNMQGSAGQKRVTTDYLKLFKVNIPPTLVEQQKVASVLSNADQEIELLELQLADLKQEKKALMQQLLTGKRRVKINNKECVA